MQYSLRNYNVAVACVHATSFVALTVISILNYDKSRRSQDFYLDAPERNVGAYPLLFTLLPFPLITALFHAAAAANAGNYYVEVLSKGMNSLRWIEYSITNGLMTFSVAALVGYTNLTNIVLLVVANVIMQLCGYAHEAVNRLKNVSTLIYLALGFLPWLYKWTLVLVYLHSNSTLTYDFVAVYGSLAFSLAFVAPLVYKYTASEPQSELVNYNTERAYLLLSLTAKLWLDWTITIGNLVEE